MCLGLSLLFFPFFSLPDQRVQPAEVLYRGYNLLGSSLHHLRTLLSAGCQEIPRNTTQPDTVCTSQLGQKTCLRSKDAHLKNLLYKVIGEAGIRAVWPGVQGDVEVLRLHNGDCCEDTEAKHH